MKYFLEFFLVSVAIGMLSGCSSSSDDFECTNENSIYCAADDSNVAACCHKSATSCYYETATRVFECAGTDCSVAADEVVDFCFGQSLTKNETYLSKMLLLGKTENMFLKNSIDDLYNDLGDEVQE